MTRDQALVILSELRARWPEAFGFGSTAVQGAWASELVAYDALTVMQTVRRLSRELRNPPALADVIADAKHVREANPVRLTAPPPRVDTGPLEEPDGYVIGPFSARFSEFNRQGWSRERLAAFARECLEGTDAIG